MEQIIKTVKPDISKLPGGWMPEAVPLLYKLKRSEPVYGTVIPGSFKLRRLLSTNQCRTLIDFFSNAPVSAPVSVQGMAPGSNNEVGSVRTTTWSPELADNLYQLAKPYLEKYKECNGNTLTDWWQGDFDRRTWETAGFSPMLRYMKYQAGGQHYAHYDAGFTYPNDNYRTLMSFVLYLTYNKTGKTRFIKDGQTGPVWERNHNDWDRPVKEDEVIASVRPMQGSILFFDHRMCHDVEPYDGAEGDRIIIRGDVLYKSYESSFLSRE